MATVRTELGNVLEGPECRICSTYPWPFLVHLNVMFILPAEYIILTALQVRRAPNTDASLSGVPLLQRAEGLCCVYLMGLTRSSLHQEAAWLRRPVSVPGRCRFRL